MFTALLAALLDKDWTTLKIEERRITSGRCIFARPKVRLHTSYYSGRSIETTTVVNPRFAVSPPLRRSVATDSKRIARHADMRITITIYGPQRATRTSEKVTCLCFESRKNGHHTVQVTLNLNDPKQFEFARSLSKAFFDVHIE
jgi:hypothetical protein